MKKTMKLLTFALMLGTVAPVGAFAAKKDKKKKEVTWEMPSKLSGLEPLDNYFNAVNSAYTNFQTFKGSVTYYTVRPIEITQADGTVKTVRAVVDQNGTVRDANKALQQYWDWGKAAINIGKELKDLVKQKDNIMAAAKKDFLTSLAFAKYITNGVSVGINGLTTLKEMVTQLSDQGKEIRQFKKDYTESGELADPTMDPKSIEDNYGNNEPIKKTSDEFEKELAAAKAEGAGVEAPDGDINVGDLFDL